MDKMRFIINISPSLVDWFSLHFGVPHTVVECLATSNRSLTSTAEYYLIYLTCPHKSSAVFVVYKQLWIHTIWTGLFNALFIWSIYGKVAQWLKFCAVNHDIMGSNPAETEYFFYYFFVFTYSLTRSLP